MHRSGTSALSGILQLLGFDLGRDLMGPNEFNPSGYWENQQVVRLNERVLSHLGTSWSDVFMLPYRLGRTNLCEIFEAEAKALLIAAFLGGALDKIGNEALRSALQEKIDAWLAQH